MKKLIWIFLIATSSCQSNDLESEINVDKTDEAVEISTKPLVSVFKVENKLFKDYFHTQGSVVSKEIAFVKPEINGVVKTIHVSEGNYITKGDPIITLSTDLLNAQIIELNEQISFAEYLFKKQQAMFKDGVSTEIQVKEIENSLNRSIKAKNTLLTQLAKAKIFAPFNGYVEEVSIKLGESISPMNNICQLVNTDNLYLVADISENLLSEVTKGDPLSVYFPALDLRIEGLNLSRVGKIINPINRTLKIESRLPKNDILIPNLMAEMSINHYSRDSAVCLPSRLILKNAKGETYLKVLDKNNMVNLKPIELGRRDQSEVEIITQIEKGTLVVDDGKSTVLSGQEVEIISKIKSLSLMFFFKLIFCFFFFNDFNIILTC
jgi:membrane fusion protein (multidrug efflux system)